MSSQHSDTDALEERLHFQRVITTYQQYARFALSANNRRRKDFFALPFEDLKLLEDIGYRIKLQEVDDAILINKSFLDQIVSNPEIFGHNLEDSEGQNTEDSVSGRTGYGYGHDHDDTLPTHSHGDDHSHSHSHPKLSGGSKGGPSRVQNQPTESDLDKLRSTIKQLVRDWSEEGLAERNACYKPMIEALLLHFSSISEEQKSRKRVLVPGAGLGRLAFDVAKLGFACQGNEFSHYMLLASYFILNRTNEVNEHTIYPYVHSFSNMYNKESMLRPIKIPDVLPSSLPQGSNFSLVAGDFEEIYGGESVDPDEPHSGQWDAILTCFFIDTAKNIVNYIRIIHQILAPGGIWINLGPLLWHWENNTSNDLSIELDLEEVKALISNMGFDISNEKMLESTYTNNSQGMLGYTYNTAFWTATKKVE